MTRVNVRAYATLRKYLPDVSLGSAVTLELPNGATLGDLVRELGIPETEVKVAFVNGLQREDGCLLQDGDRVALFPPIAGG